MRDDRTVARRVVIAVALVALVFLTSGGVALANRRSPQQAGGPVALMGIDAEDGGPGSHGPISIYADVVTKILANVQNGGTGILVVGGGKLPAAPPAAADDVTAFWNAISTTTGLTVTFVHGAANVAAKSFTGFQMVAVASSIFQTPLGGLSEPEDVALGARAADVATFVNNGGAILGFSQAGFGLSANSPTAFFYLGGIGGFTSNESLTFSVIDPTPEGTTLGITSALDVCCWKDEFITFPSFLHVLATNHETGHAVALGGSRIVLTPTTTTTTTSTTVPTATVATTTTTTTTTTTIPVAPAPKAVQNPSPKLKVTG